jgi:hypothetical protein
LIHPKAEDEKEDESDTEEIDHVWESHLHHRQRLWPMAQIREYLHTSPQKPRFGENAPRFPGKLIPNKL